MIKIKINYRLSDFDYHLNNIEISTVDRFQGLEKHIIIFSTVRHNSRGSIGYLNFF
jgi:superfamily I DNA and/or RNA helicase